MDKKWSTIHVLTRINHHQQHTGSLCGKSVTVAELVLLYCCPHGWEHMEQSQTLV